MSPDVRALVDAYRVVRPAVQPVLPALVLAGFGIVALLADLFELGRTRGPAEGEEGTPIMAPYLALIGVVTALGVTIWQAIRLGGWAGRYFNGMIVVDGFGVFLEAVVLVGTLLTLLLTVGYCRRQNIQLSEYYHLILMAAAGMLLMVVAHNLLMIFVSLELMSVGAYVLTGFRRTRLSSIEGALKYFVMGAFSTGFFLYGMALIYGATGSLDLSAIEAAVATPPASGVLLAGVGLLLVGFGFKVALVPFHMWSPDVYQGAPAPVTGFMATGIKTAGFAAFARFFLSTFDGLNDQWTPILWVLAVLTMFVGNLAAIRQDDIKRMLAYSSIAHAGYLLVALVAHGAPGTAALLFYLAAYTLMTIGAFGVVIVIGERGSENTSIERDYAGMGYRHPLLAAAMALFMFSLTGIPPTAGFVGKFTILAAAVESGHVPLAILLVLASVVSAYYYLKVVVSMYMWSPARERPARIVVPTMAGIALLVAVVGVLGLGLFPGSWIELARSAVDGLLTVAAVGG